MKYVDEYRDKDLISKLIDQIKKISEKQISIMEVCGGHTMAIHKFGIHSLLPSNIRLLSGPGCPVCVTSREFIDKAIALSGLKNVIITTYGDLVRVPGSDSSLEKEKACGADIRIVYSTLDALTIARENPTKKIVFLGIGFETTTPSSAIGIAEADRNKTANFFLLSAHKVMPPAMEALIDEGALIDGYIGPGHVTTIAGAGMYDALVKKYNLAIVVSGFEPLDLVQSIYMLVKQIETGKQKVEIQYKRAVTYEGNTKAQQLVHRIFEYRDDWWRGLGLIKNSGLKIRSEYANFDAEKQFDIKVNPAVEPHGCICGEILKGQGEPTDCKLFGKACTPENPIGACMVSNEGTCNAFYRYRTLNLEQTRNP